MRRIRLWLSAPQIHSFTSIVALAIREIGSCSKLYAPMVSLVRSTCGTCPTMNAGSQLDHNSKAIILKNRSTLARYKRYNSGIYRGLSCFQTGRCTVLTAKLSGTGAGATKLVPMKRVNIRLRGPMLTSLICMETGR